MGRYKKYLLLAFGAVTFLLATSGYMGDLRSHTMMLAEQCATRLKLVRDSFMALFRLA
jgi:hypothetical protein